MRPIRGSLLAAIAGLALAGCASGGDTGAAPPGGDDASSTGDGTAMTDAPGGGDGTTHPLDAGRDQSSTDAGSPGDGTTVEPDGASDAAIGDSSTPADAPGPDAMPDSGSTTAQDAGADAAPDTGAVQGAEAGIDSGSSAQPDAGCNGPGSVECGNTCCNPINGTCNANCTLSCAGGYGHCTGDPSQGCETSTSNDTSDCGGCGRTCSASEVSTLECTSGLCNSSCLPGWGNCNEPSAPSPDDGCESNLTTCIGTPCCGTLCSGQHPNGLGQTYSDCSPLGVPGNPATYSATMADEAANSWPNPGGTPAQILTGGACYESNQVTQDQCDASYTFSACAVWCFSGQLAGYVYENIANDYSGTGSNCLCPALTSGATWN